MVRFLLKLVCFTLGSLNRVLVRKVLSLNLISMFVLFLGFILYIADLPVSTDFFIYDHFRIIQTVSLVRTVRSLSCSVIVLS